MDTCHECGDEYKRIAQHWQRSDCKYQDLSEHQHKVITGFLMGDGSLSSKNKNPYVQTGMTTKDYLIYLSEEILPVCSGDVNMGRTAAECAQRDRESGFRPNAKEEEYSDMYRWNTMCHPELKRYESWYRTGEKAFPENIELTPTVLKHWFVCDGYLANGKYAGISLNNEGDNEKKITDMFNRAGLTDFFWSGPNLDKGDFRAFVRFRAEGTENFFDYIGSPLPGFAYKWR